MGWVMVFLPLTLLLLGIPIFLLLLPPARGDCVLLQLPHRSCT